MAGKTVTAPGGERWRVRRQWVPRWRGRTLWGRVRYRWRRDSPVRRFGRGVGEAADGGCVLDAVDDLAFLAILVIVALLLVLFVVPLLVALLDLLVVILLVALGAAARVLFRRPWGVEAEVLDGPAAGRLVTWQVVGWRASNVQIEAVAERLSAGWILPAGGAESWAQPTPKDEPAAAAPLPGPPPAPPPPGPQDRPLYGPQGQPGYGPQGGPPGWPQDQRPA